MHSEALFRNANGYCLGRSRSVSISGSTLRSCSLVVIDITRRERSRKHKMLIARKLWLEDGMDLVTSQTN